MTMNAEHIAIGEHPIDFYGDQDGGLVVMAIASSSPNYPRARITLIAGRGNVMTSDDAVAAALTIEQATDLIDRLTVAKMTALGAAGRFVRSFHGSNVLVESDIGAWGAGESETKVQWYRSEELAREAFDRLCGVAP
jgi:hypothetical protein